MLQLEKIIDFQMAGGNLLSKESSDNAFNNPSPEFLAWAEDYAEVMTCDIEGRYPWTFYLPREPDSFGEVMGEMDNCI